MEMRIKPHTMMTSCGDWRDRNWGIGGYGRLAGKVGFVECADFQTMHKRHDASI